MDMHPLTRICGRPAPDEEWEVDPMDIEARLRALLHLQDEGMKLVGLRPRQDIMDFDPSEMTVAQRECFQESGCVPVVISRTAMTGRGKAKRVRPKVCIVPPEGAFFELEDALSLLHKCGTVLEPVPRDQKRGLLPADDESLIHENHRTFLVEYRKRNAEPVEVTPVDDVPVAIAEEPKPKPKRTRKAATKAPAKRTRKASTPTEPEGDA